MQVTGYKLKEALKLKAIELQAVQSLFDESLYKFEGEEKLSPEEVVDKIKTLEDQIAKLQTAQSYYNLQVIVEVNGKKGFLETAIKLVGGAGRVSKMWRTASAGRTRDRWDRSNIITRRTDEVMAEPTVNKITALEKAKEAEKFASALRSAIAVGNTNIVDVDWIDEKLFS